MSLEINPFDGARYLGSVIRVDTTSVTMNIPVATRATSNYAGHRIGYGEIGEFVAIQGELHAVIGRITVLRIPEAERLTVERNLSCQTCVNPIAVIQLLLCVDLVSGKTITNTVVYPKVGQYVYSAHPELVSHVFKNDEIDTKQSIEFAHLVGSPTTKWNLSPITLFGKHCAILGATGGGKSWTLARLLEQLVVCERKAILFDPTGEYKTLSRGVEHVYLGKQSCDTNDKRRFVSFPHHHLSMQDLFVMFRPSVGAQTPKLRDAIKSLKLVKLVPQLCTNGVLKKANQSREEIDKAYRDCAEQIRSSGTDYDVMMLPFQIEEECVYPTDRQNLNNFGSEDKTTLGHCITLVNRVESMISSTELEIFFQPNKCGDDITEVLDTFVKDKNEYILRISMEHLSYEHHTREIVANALGKYLLGKARAGMFQNRPTLIALDEAHGFLNKNVGDEHYRYSLDSFSLIAKEGRKHGLFTLLATQRPRDIPSDILSQVGKFIVHQLNNNRDRQIVEQSCEALDTESLRFLPSLGAGEALVIGQGLPSAVPVQILKPKNQPLLEDLTL